MENQCVCGFLGQTMAERLIDIADAVRLSSVNVLLVCAETKPPDAIDNDVMLARVKLAMDFQDRGAAVVFRAIFEEWDRDRIFREVY